MLRRLPESLRLALLIALPLVAAGTAMLWSTASMLSGISESVDAQEHERAWQAVQSAFKAKENQLASVMADNARWGEAVQNSYRPVNEAWIHDMWGLTTGDINYDVAYIVEPDGIALAAYRDGEPSAETPADYLGGSLGKILAEMPLGTEEFKVITTMVMTHDGLVALAAGPIVPNGEEGISVPAKRANVLLFGHHITASDLARMGEQYIVESLSLDSADGKAGAEGILRDRWNEPVAHASWQDRHPGVTASANYRNSAYFLLIGLIAVMLPITAVHLSTMRKLAHSRRQAQHDARHDTLTGLPNRSMLADELPKALADSAAGDTVLLCIDLDGFKGVNDSYGHETGDRLLIAIADGLRHLAGNGLLARLGGDEFALLLTGKKSRLEAETIASNIVSFVKEPFDIGGRSACVGASIGLARGEIGMSPGELVRRADIAMYDAKESGRGLWRWFNHDLDIARAEDLEIAAELRSFIAENKFQVAYQPIVDAATRRIAAVEALARWPASSPRQLTPDQFIPIAEHHGLIGDLGAMIARQACRSVAGWPGVRLSLNVSPFQLNNRDFVASLKRIAAEEGLELARIEVELTEAVLVRNARRAQDVIAELHANGIRVALDDFGTGFASIGYLRNFAFDTVKIDKSLTNSILVDAVAQRVVQGTVLIAQGLSAEIVAEGIESEDMANVMRLTGCHQLQGYHFGRPLSADAITQMFATAEATVRQAAS